MGDLLEESCVHCPEAGRGIAKPPTPERLSTHERPTLDYGLGKLLI
jgi:hypothetical protein